MEHVDWISSVHTATKSKPLTADNQKTPARIPRFKGTLFTPQRSTLFAMISLEQNPYLIVESSDSARMRMTSKIARISEKFSFGKTVVSLALVCAHQIPAYYATHPCVEPRASKYGSRTSEYDRLDSRRLPSVVVEYGAYSRFTIVIAASGIISQWEINISKFTDLRHFVVENVHSLRLFESEFRRNRGEKIDILLVKAGKITSSFTVHGEPPMNKQSKHRSLFDAITLIMEGVPAARLIIDDFDTLKLSSSDCYIPALFTWLISSTCRQSFTYPLQQEPSSVEEYFKSRMSHKLPILSSAADLALNGAFNISCSPEYVNSYLTSTRIDYQVIRIECTSDISILKALGVSGEVMEMLNAGAMETASNALGLNAGTMVAQLVGNRIHKIKRLKEQLNYYKNLLQSGTSERVDDIINSIEKNIEDILTPLRRARENISTKGLSNNVRSCQCCSVDFDDGGDVYMMAECCQLIICSYCAYSRRGRKCQIRRCPNCAKSVTSTGIVKISLDDKFEPDLDEYSKILSMPINSHNSGHTTGEGQSKISALINILNDSSHNESKDTELTKIYGDNCNVDNLLVGSMDVPWPKTLIKKYLIFSMYPESAAIIHEALTDSSIDHVILCGNIHKKTEAISLFRTTINVMIISAAKDASGLDLPFISDIIFYHKIIDLEVEAQVIARGQRLGRTHNLRVTFLLNDGE